MLTNKDILRKNPHRLFLQYLFPSIAATLFISLNFMVDTICVGQKLGEMGITALGIAQPVPGILYALGLLFGVGGSTLYSIHLGKGEDKTARAIYTACFTVILISTTLILMLGLVFLPQITTFLGGTGAAREGVRDYLLYVLAFAPVFSLETFLCSFLRNDNAPKLAMIATFIGSGLNIILDLLFVIVFEKGIVGASLATSISIAVGVVFLLLCTMRPSSHMRLSGLKTGVHYLLRILRLGGSSLIMEIAASITLLVFNRMLLYLSGETAVAVYGVIGNLTIIVGNALQGVSNAMQPLVSMNIGSGRYRRGSTILKYALGYSLLVAFILCVIGELWPVQLIHIFVNGEESFLAMAVPALRIIFFSYILTSVNTLLSTYFQAVNEGNHAFFFSLLRSIVCPVLFSVSMGTAFGLDGIWYSPLMTEGISVLIALWLFRSVRKRLRVRNYSRLNYFSGKKAHESLEEILTQLGTDDLSGFEELMQYCDSRDEIVQGIPTFVCLEDFTTDYEGGYAPAEQDEGMGLFLAVGGLILTDLYEQNEVYIQDKLREADYPAAAPAMNVLAEKCFRFEYEETTDKTTVIPYRRGMEDLDWGNGEWMREEPE